MKQSLPNQSYALTLIAETGDRFSDFAPYVASINDHGVVAFQAALSQGGTGIFTGDGGPVATVADTTGGYFGEFYSHPDIDNNHALSVYARLQSGVEGVFLARDGQVSAAADTTGSFASIGPLGPTMNDHGGVAFRAETEPGFHGVCTTTGESVVAIADTSKFSEFHGLPVINGVGTVVFRADVENGKQAIYARDNDSQSLHAVVDTNHIFTHLGSFPCINDPGTIVFNATRKNGSAGIHAVTSGEIVAVIEADDSFDSFRGALIDNAGTVIFYATPRAGRLGVYARLGVHAILDARAAAAPVVRLLSMGDSLLGSAIVDFALNPVSMNQLGQLAIRVELASGKQAIVRVEPTRA